MRYFIALLFFVSFESYSSTIRWEYIYYDSGSNGGRSCSAQLESVLDAVSSPSYQEKYYNHTAVHVEPCKGPNPQQDFDGWSYIVVFGIPTDSQCPEGTDPPIYPSTECTQKPKPDEGDVICGDGNCNPDGGDEPPGGGDNPDDGGTPICDDGNCNPGGGDNPGGGGGGDGGSGGGGDGGGIDLPGGGENPPEGGEDNPPGGGDNPPGGGENPPGGDGEAPTDDNDPYAFCKEYPELCSGWEDCPTPDAPWLCDTRPECDPSQGDVCLDCDPNIPGDCTDTDSVIAAINEVKHAVRDHNKTTFDVENNTDATAKNTKAIADNTDKTNDLLTQIRDLNQSGNDILDNKMVEMMGKMDGISGDITQAAADIAQAIEDNPSGGGGSDLDPEPEKEGGTDCSLPENQDLLVCTKLKGTVPTESEDPFDDILNEDDLNRLGEDIDALKDDIKKLKDEFSEGLGDVSIQESGTVPVITATITKAGRTFTARNNVWIENSDIIRSVVLALASLAAFSIILLRRR